MSDLLYAGVIEQITGQTIAEDFDFTGLLPSGVTVLSVVNSVTNAEGVITEGVVLASSLATPIATLTIATGATETTYLVKSIATGSNSKTYTLIKQLNVHLQGVYR